MSLFNELKRRNVFRVAAAYLVIGWLLVQVLGLAADSFQAPAWVMKMIITGLLIGFLPTMLFSWAYELTPEGLKKDSQVDQSQSNAPPNSSQTADKLNVITLIAVIGVVGLFAYQQMNPSATVSANQTEALDLSGGENVVNKPEDISAVKPEVQVGLTLGVAVLPFSNLSEDASNAFFAGGVHEDVLTYLSRIDKLRVISRTSMLKIAERDMDVREIGKHLNVSHVLEGSVRRAGDQVRVTVQLIDASNDNHLWAENYDRKLDDIFLIQTEIAKAIAGQLKTELSPKAEQALSTFPTQNIKAYDLFLRARKEKEVWRAEKTFFAIIPLLEQAIELDPNFLAAEVDLAAAYGRIQWLNVDPDGIYTSKARDLTERIVKQHPNSSEAYQAQANYHYTVEKDYSTALIYYQKALADSPNNANVLESMANSFKRLGQYEQGIQTIQKAIELDPENPSLQIELAIQLRLNGQTKESLAQFLQLQEKSPQLNNAWFIAEIYFGSFGNLEKAKEILLLQDKPGQWAMPSVMRASYDSDRDYMAEYQALKTADFKLTKNELSAVELDADLLMLLKIGKQGELAKETAVGFISEYENWIKDNPNSLLKRQYTALSYVACVAQDQDKFNDFQKIYQNLEVTELGTDYYELMNTLALAECGQVVEAWQAIENLLAQDDVRFGPWSVILDPIYAHYFSQRPEFQNLQTEMRAQQDVKGDKQ